MLFRNRLAIRSVRPPAQTVSAGLRGIDLSDWSKGLSICLMQALMRRRKRWRVGKNRAAEIKTDKDTESMAHKQLHAGWGGGGVEGGEPV